MRGIDVDRLVFIVQGSQAEPYQVILEKNGGNLNAYCTCAAGANGQYCKHRFRILSGNAQDLIDPDSASLCLAVDWLVGTDVETAIIALAKAEDGFAKAKAELAQAKKAVAKAMMS